MIYTDAKGAETRYKYDAADRIRQLYLPDGIIVDYTYYIAGNASSIKDNDLPVRIILQAMIIFFMYSMSNDFQSPSVLKNKNDGILMRLPWDYSRITASKYDSGILLGIKCG